MSFTDILLMIIILGGAFYILYRSFWKKKGACKSCMVDECGQKKNDDKTSSMKNKK